MKSFLKLAPLPFIFAQILNASNLNNQTESNSLPGFEEFIKPLEDDQSSPHFINTVNQLEEKHAKEYFSNGMYFFKNDQFLEAIPYFKKTLELPNLEETFRANVYHHLGNAYLTTEKFDQAIPCYISALPKRIGADRASTLHNLGLIYTRKREYKSSIHFFEEALEITERKGEPRARTHHHLGIIYSQLLNSAEAISHYKQALKIPEWQGSFRSNTLTYLSIVYTAQKQYDPAISSLREILEVQGLPNIIYAHTYFRLGHLYFRQKDYKLAYVTYEKSSQFKELIGESRVKVFERLSVLLSEYLKKNPLDALLYAQQAQQLKAELSAKNNPYSSKL